MSALIRLLTLLLAAFGLHSAGSIGRMPAGVTTIEIHSAAGVTATVTRPPAVAKIVKWFDALPHFEAVPCPIELYYPPAVKFAFRAADGSLLLHAVDRAPGTCPSSIGYSSGGRAKNTPLADNGFVARVSRLLGVSFDPNGRTAENEIAAKLDARTLLGLSRVPPGSRSLRTGAWAHRTTAVADAHRTWTVHLPLEQAFAWVQSHRPRGSSETGTGTGGRWGVITGRELLFSFAPVTGRIASRELDFELGAMRDGWTRIRVDARDTWVVARSPNERVPAGVTQVLFRSRLITDPAKVAKIVRWFDALPIVQPGAGFSCPFLVYGPVVELDFLNPAGHVLAHARMLMRLHGGGLLSTSCTPIELILEGRHQAPLVGGRFFSRVEKLLR